MRKSLLTLAAGLALVLGSGVQAQGYVGAAAGWTKLSADCSDLDKCDKTDTGGKLYGGYKFANQFAVEAVYFDWGKATAEGTLTIADLAGISGRKVASAVTGTISESLKLRSTGYGLGVAYFMPFATDWTGVARLGVARNKGKLSATATDGVTTESLSESTNATVPYVGIGIGYNLSRNLAITAEADFSRVKYGFDGVTEKDDLQMISIGLRFSF